MYDFQVPTSSARSVNSSGLSLTVTSGYPSDPFGLRFFKKFTNLRSILGHDDFNLKKFSQPLREALAAPLTEVCHDVDCCRHVCNTCESMLTTQTVGGRTRGSAMGKVHGDSGDAQLPHVVTSGPGGAQGVRSIANFPDGVTSASFGHHANPSPASSDCSTNAFHG